MEQAQVVIVGGGAMGVSLLYHLVELGWSDVILVEKNDLTHGSTWHAAGLCTHFSHSPTIQMLRATSVRLYRDILPARTGEDCGFHSSGAMRVTRSADRMTEFAHVAGLSKFTGFDLRVVTPAQIAELHPLAQLDGLLGGIYEPDDGHVDPTLATNAMAKVAREGGGRIMRQSPVLGITRDDDHWLVETAKGTIRTRHVVNAAGTWGWEIGRMMGLNIPSVPMLHQYLVTDTVPVVAERLAAGLPELPIIRDPEESWYVRQERDGLILGPYERHAPAWSIDGVPPEFGAELLPPELDRIESIIEAAMARIPALGDGGIKSVVNGPITYTPDANPLIGPAHGLEGAWLLTGSSMGVMEGGGAGWFLAHWMTHGAPPMEAHAVDSRRFGIWAGRDYRVEKAIEAYGLQFGIHYPHEERPAARNRRTTPLHELMLERGAVMGAVHGWERPNWFSDKPGAISQPGFGTPDWQPHVQREVDATTTTVALQDISVLSKFMVEGIDLLDFLAELGANRPPRIGRIGLTHALTPQGGVHSEFTVSLLDNGRALLTSAAAAEERDEDLLRHLAQRFDVTLRNVTEDYGAIAVMGPKSRELLSRLGDSDLSDTAFPWLSVQRIQVAQIAVIALRMSYVGELGWELHIPRDHTVTVFRALEEAGRDLGLGYYGAFAADSMRLEKGYRAWGSDLISERTPCEAGLDALVSVERRVFTGRDALLARRTSPDHWSMALVSVEGVEQPPFFGHPVKFGDRVVGLVTSGAYGCRTGLMLALCYFRSPLPDREMTIEILGQDYPARMLDTVPFDPGNGRLRAASAKANPPETVS
ncbi:FAD-dependent oxidoreductase [Paracoccus sp. N5]|uniref:GcvT family protein n=1 Tax=Paracoccus sp. N5 TaxID=1101189 RepID=UPI0003A1AE14|nr:FAD-dependent oxidoreductase [Paracoccus sp. N5]